MFTERKTIRFYDTEQDKVALEALNNYADYGFSSANDMVVGALYELAMHRSHGTNEIDPNGLADMIAERLKGSLHLVSAPATTDTSITTEEDTTETTITEVKPADTIDFASAMDFLDSL